MPIRFACPHCRQKLSVSSRKAGTTADCPRCKRSLHIPEPPPEPKRLEPGAPPAAKRTPEPIKPPVAPPKPAPESPSVASQPEGQPEPFTAPAATAVMEQAPEAAMPPEEQPEAAAEMDAVFTPDSSDFDGLELVYDTEPSQPAVRPATADLIAIPRYVIYLQGGLLGLVALLAFTIGVLTGGAILTQPAAPAPPQACTITGSVMYAAGTRQRPDDGAVIAILPLSGDKPDEKAPVQGLRPGDPSPGENHRGIAILRAAGGDYARADANGRFQLRLPDRGRYLVVAISNQRLLRSPDDIATADILKIGPFFENAADLLGNHQYRLLQEQFRGDRELSLTFD